MALIKLGGLAQDVRGSLNGTTFSRNRGGAYVRTKVSPVQPVSDFSSRSRAIFADLSMMWATTLTQSDRAAWIAFAAVHTFVNVFGDTLTVSGINMFMSVNRALGQVGKPYLVTPPATFDVPSVVSVTALATITEDGDPLTVFTQTTVLSAALPTDGTLYVFATPPLPAGRTPQKSQFRLLNDTPYSAVTLTTAFLALYNARFDSPAVNIGQQIALRVACLDWSTGAIGPGVTITVIPALD